MHQCPAIYTTIIQAWLGSGVEDERDFVVSKKGEKNVAVEPRRQKIDSVTCDDDISTSTPMLRGGQDSNL